ncbi:MAG TPA: hypothetical protein VLL52_09375, partial [Anaerolineae bacterium]|nr:hypothetical protein [Anaerolineae bacterium]
PTAPPQPPTTIPSYNQNDAASGQDAGPLTSPLTITPTIGYKGTLTGRQNGNDLIDTYRLRANPHDIIQIVVSNNLTNTNQLDFMLTSDVGYILTHTLKPAQNDIFTLSSARRTTYHLQVTHDGAMHTAHYRFDILLDTANDANTTTDAPDAPPTALPIQTDTLYTGSLSSQSIQTSNPDCYQLTLTENSQLAISLTSPPEQPYPAPLIINLYAPDHTLLKTATTNYDTSTTFTYGPSPTEETTSGRYIFCLTTETNYPYALYQFTATIN